MIEVSINNKWPLKLPESAGNEWIGNMKWHGEWEGPRLNRLYELITAKPGCVVMYIGSYKGDMAALLATWGAQLVLMEGTPAFWHEIKETWELNDLPEPLGCYSGLLSRVSTNTLTKEELTQWPERTEEFIEGRVGFSHLAESGGHFPEITVDEFVRVTGIVPDIITMDVEGSELEVLYGGIETIEKYRPTCLISEHPEFMFHNHGTYIRELHDLFENRDYKPEYLDFDHEFHFLYTPK